MDMNDRFIEDSTMAFLRSYDVAMRETRNPQIAGMASAVVTSAFMDRYEQRTESNKQLTALVKAVTDEKRRMQEEKDARSDKGGGSDG